MVEGSSEGLVSVSVNGGMFGICLRVDGSGWWGSGEEVRVGCFFFVLHLFYW